MREEINLGIVNLLTGLSISLCCAKNFVAGKSRSEPTPRKSSCATCARWWPPPSASCMPV